VVLPRHQRRHEEYAIASINPMAKGEVHFANVRDVLEDFLLNSARVGVRKIQKCPFLTSLCQVCTPEGQGQNGPREPARF
jgi:hypothetical protein